MRREEVVDSPVIPTDLTESLRDIRIAYDQLSSNTATDMEKIYKANVRRKCRDIWASIEKWLRYKRYALLHKLSCVVDRPLPVILGGG